MSNDRLLTGTSQEAGTRGALSPLLQPCSILKTVPLILLPECFPGVWCLSTAGRHSARTAFVSSSRMGSRTCYRLIRRAPALQSSRKAPRKNLGCAGEFPSAFTGGSTLPIFAPGVCFVFTSPPFSFSSLSGHLGPTGAAIT